MDGKIQGVNWINSRIEKHPYISREPETEPEKEMSLADYIVEAYKARTETEKTEEK